MILYAENTKHKYGALKGSGALTSTQRSQLVANTLKCKWIRTKIVVFGAAPNTTSGGWNGSSPIYEVNDGLGLGQVVVIGAYPSGSVQPFVTSGDWAQYGSIIADILDTYPKIKLIVIDNEEETTSYHSGPYSDYGGMLQAAYTVAHPRGVKVADGGILNAAGLHVKVYRWLVTKYNQSTATTYGSTIMTPHQVGVANGTIVDSAIEQLATDIDTILSYKAYVDYWNMHFYEQPASPSTTTITPNVLRYQKEFLQDVGKRLVISNECGQRNNSQPLLVTNLMNEFYRLNFEHVQWWDGTGNSGAMPLTNNTTGAILPNGTAFKNFIITH